MTNAISYSVGAVKVGFRLGFFKMAVRDGRDLYGLAPLHSYVQ